MKFGNATKEMDCLTYYTQWRILDNAIHRTDFRLYIFVHLPPLRPFPNHQIQVYNVMCNRELELYHHRVVLTSVLANR